ncbi:3-phosphoshikimate 1-carboxyvinyltransferase [Limibacillus halophilus]|uniref:3-phosphoshikimate 1-carboxyvinyltransferase n=2 Tax=Limibacillus halophilus TaxID=1579333 RepID=A0A839SPY4_9PROT|nr:3-phosphoshikimate 1-carboxyvinyltransferase [Limibacillus halophilus]MBB3063999.1 3-phosphoshikimate 1-carboxyvinyltransferase [Limibacillus halophilus]
MTMLNAAPAGALKGDARVPGDKSISHRALMLGGLALGETTVTGLLEGEDVMATAAAMRELGAIVERQADGSWRILGRGVGSLREPSSVLDLGNSGTSARLLSGILASHPLTAVVTGDASLCKRPMGRVIEPLRAMGGEFQTREGGRLPMTVIGSDALIPVEYTLPVPSAQVKSAILFAGLNTAGNTSVIETTPTRDHSERMLRAFGAELTVEPGDNGTRITLVGQAELKGCSVAVPADPSSAAFPLVAALLLPGSEVRLPNVGMNPQRIGLIEVLREMGGDITIENLRDAAGEPVADLLVRASKLQGICVPAERAASMIDEYPILAVAAAAAEGRTEMQGLGELRVKESDRLAVMARGLEACGVTTEEGEDWLTVVGTGGSVTGGALIEAELDHRIAMSFLVLGSISEKGVRIDDGSPIDTSFPGFVDLMNNLGARITTGAP